MIREEKRVREKEKPINRTLNVRASTDTKSHEQCEIGQVYAPACAVNS